jgi:hypothetical protein
MFHLPRFLAQVQPLSYIKISKDPHVVGLGVELHKPVHLSLPQHPGLQRFTELFSFDHVTNHPARLVVAVNAGYVNGQGLRQAFDEVRPSDSLPWSLLDSRCILRPSSTERAR